MLIGSVIKEHYFFIGQETVDKFLIKLQKKLVYTVWLWLGVTRPADCVISYGVERSSKTTNSQAEISYLRK